MIAKAPARELSIKGKLTRMVMLTSGAALLMACFGFALYDLFTFRQEKVRELSSFAEIIAASSAKSLTSMDAGAAGEIVGSLPSDRNILAACLYSAQGQLLTGFVSRAGSQDTCPDHAPVHGHNFQGNRLRLSHPAVLSGKTAGTVLLISGLDEMWVRLVRYSAISGVVLLASILVAFIASARLRAIISRPILALSGAAREISQEQDYSVRVEKLTGGELGALTDAFNDMLSQIQVRDEELLKAQGELEKKFEEKKSQLREETDGRQQAEKALQESAEALRQSQKMEAVGRLAGGVAHDFNNLLTAIMGYTDMIVGSLAEDDPLRSQVVEIRKASHRAADLTRQLLAFSRKQVLDPKVLNLNWNVTNLERMLQRLIGEDIELATSLGDSLGRIKADPGQVEQVILNLAVNARDAMPDGGRLMIETSNVEIREGEGEGLAEPGSYVMLQMSDTGCGMDDETRSRVFEPFFTTKEEGKGTGLGLSTVYGIVTQSGGTITVSSTPGSGTSFRILFPRVAQEADPLRPSQDEVPCGGTETILLVEDEELVRDLAREILTTQGYKVLEASGGGRALEICREHPDPIHLMLSDVVMPELNGPAVYQQVSALRNETAVLYMSGYTGMLDPGQGKIGQDDPFIQKPFTPTDLARKIREVLDASRPAAAAPPADRPEGEGKPPAPPEDRPGGEGTPADPLEVPAEEGEEEMTLSLDPMAGL